MTATRRATCAGSDLLHGRPVHVVPVRQARTGRTFVALVTAWPDDLPETFDLREMYAAANDLVRLSIPNAVSVAAALMTVIDATATAEDYAACNAAALERIGRPR